jgi:hypothetical protein
LGVGAGTEELPAAGGDALRQPMNAHRKKVWRIQPTSSGIERFMGTPGNVSRQAEARAARPAGRSAVLKAIQRGGI